MNIQTHPTGSSTGSWSVNPDTRTSVGTTTSVADIDEDIYGSTGKKLKLGSSIETQCCVFGKESIMICINHICLELFLYMIILMRAVASDNDTELEKTRDNSCRMFAEIWNSSCTSGFQHTGSLNDGIEYVSDSSTCLSWNISVTVDGEECTIISKSNCFLDEKDKCNCHGEHSPTNTFNGESTDKITGSRDEENEVDNNDGIDESSKDGGDKNENDDDFANACHDDTDISKEYKDCFKRRMEKKCRRQMKKLNNERPTARGILVLTHIVAAGIGAGILYCILFMKTIKRRLNNKNEEERNTGIRLNSKNKEERNTGINNASYNLQEGSTENTSVPFFSHHDEGVYCEVAENPRSLPSHNSASLHPFAENVSEGRKNTRLPDIPHQTEKDYNQYMTPISRSLPHEYLNSSGKAITETYTMDENELRTEDGKIKDNSVLNDVDSLKDTFETETFGQYFVLEKSTDMDLK